MDAQQDAPLVEEPVGAALHLLHCCDRLCRRSLVIGADTLGPALICGLRVAGWGLRPFSTVGWRVFCDRHAQPADLIFDVNTPRTIMMACGGTLMPFVRCSASTVRTPTVLQELATGAGGWLLATVDPTQVAVLNAGPGVGGGGTIVDPLCHYCGRRLIRHLLKSARPGPVPTGLLKLAQRFGESP